MARLGGSLLIGHTLPGVTSGVSQRSILGPVVFNNFINDAEEAMRLVFIKFAGDTILGGAVVLQSLAVVQRDLSRLEERASRSFLKFHEDKCPASGKGEAVLLIQTGLPGRLATLLKRSWGMFSKQQAEYQPAVCPCSREGNCVPGCNEKNIASR